MVGLLLFSQLSELVFACFISRARCRRFASYHSQVLVKSITKTQCRRFATYRTQVPVKSISRARRRRFASYHSQVQVKSLSGLGQLHFFFLLLASFLSLAFGVRPRCISCIRRCHRDGIAAISNLTEISYRQPRLPSISGYRHHDRPWAHKFRRAIVTRARGTINARGPHEGRNGEHKIK